MFIKRLFDLTASGIALLFLAPLFLVVALAIKLDSRGPVFYMHPRVGKDRKPFSMYKFRSMVQRADQLGGALTVSGDSRITRIGATLRKTKIDELPNLINVFTGEMSIVGPRGEHARYVAMYTEDQMRVLSVNPGITDPGLAGKYRNEQEILAEVDDPESHYINVIMQYYLKMNLEYVDAEYSFRGDMLIILRTIRAIFTGK